MDKLPDCAARDTAVDKQAILAGLQVSSCCIDLISTSRPCKRRHRQMDCIGRPARLRVTGCGGFDGQLTMRCLPLLSPKHPSGAPARALPRSRHPTEAIARSSWKQICKVYLSLQMHRDTGMPHASTTSSFNVHADSWYFRSYIK
jgi:hypothetical protein